ncbi:hypothetical protein VTO42DRAFT_2569 [Malbranchea cinnamomea]
MAAYAKAATPFREHYSDLPPPPTYEVVKRPYGVKLLPLKWVFVYKFDDLGFLTRHKARLCVRSDLQEKSDLDSRATTLAACQLRALMAICAAFDLETCHYDVVNAFTTSDMDEVVYTQLPDGSKIPGYLFFYVNDIAVLYRKEYEADHEELRRQFFTEYEMNDLGELHWFLNIQILRDRPRQKIWLSQAATIDKIVADFGLHDYRHNPSDLHMREADRVIGYLRTTRNYALEYSGEMPHKISSWAAGPDASVSNDNSLSIPLVFEAASDAVFADDPDTCRSSEGFVMKLFGGAVDWKRRFLTQLGFDPGHEFAIYCDNKQTTDIVNKELPKLNTKLRHVDIHQHWVRERVQDGDIVVE